jgi:hypothetical protein
MRARRLRRRGAGPDIPARAEAGMAVDAVSSEPVSRSNSLLTGKFTGNFVLERAFASSLTAQIGPRPGHFSTRELD